ncbi:hypothetical protein BDP81DRAFT_435953 [Colletotrichum phormii]|uniref:Uncharacterized protein n=1 Tax=Colletotrichum phormii TaxID=359342 RepID=A0AAI9ZJ12_9PEZI|nr:uncharacterized protein BDP81DRAFT_435953 [Colletotrichum phormii]KAK1625504.1 hypothetical protein BDP81DRAFT_435953 [Colletotrichum phormii]
MISYSRERKKKGDSTWRGVLHSCLLVKNVEASRTRVWSLFYFYYVWHFLFIRHNGPPHWPEGTMSWATAVFTPFTVHDIVRRLFFYFSLHANLYRHPLERLGSGLETFSL